MYADSLAPNIWNAIVEIVQRAQQPKEITVGRVVKRHVANKTIWIHEFGETAIPLVSFDRVFAYYDTQNDGTVKRREDASDNDPAFRTRVLVPRVGQMAVILNQWGNGRFPVCIGVIQSMPGTYWRGETS